MKKLLILKNNLISSELFKKVLLMTVILVSNYNATYASEITDNIKKLLQNGYAEIASVITPIAFVLCVICVLLFFFAPGKQTSQFGWTWLKRIAISYFVFMSLPTIFEVFAGWFGWEGVSEGVDEIINFSN